MAFVEPDVLSRIVGIDHVGDGRLVVLVAEIGVDGKIDLKPQKVGEWKLHATANRGTENESAHKSALRVKQLQKRIIARQFVEVVAKSIVAAQPAEIVVAHALAVALAEALFEAQAQRKVVELKRPHQLRKTPVELEKLKPGGAAFEVVTQLSVQRTPVVFVVDRFGSDGGVVAQQRLRLKISPPLNTHRWPALNDECRRLRQYTNAQGKKEAQKQKSHKHNFKGVNINERIFVILFMCKKILLLVIGGLSLTHCQPKKTASGTSEPRRFELMKPEQTGVTFVNRLTERTDLNIFNYLYMYNGAGVAAGDVNNDGLCDLFFTSNQEKNALYLNRGNFKFEDITDKAEVGGRYGWTTGAAMADVNGDGLLDVYISKVSGHPGLQGKNQLFINLGPDEQGIPSFEDQADRYGLALTGYCTQAAFFDYDRDGDLDMYQLRHSVHNNGTFGTKSELRHQSHPLSGDKLLRNDNGRFTDVTAAAGIYSAVIGYGLGIATGDVNLDGWPDIYIGNDFHEDDYLYLNNGDGTFREALNDCIGHTSRFAMGVDIADCNNDGLPDIVSLDMLPSDPKILKSSASEDPPDVFAFKLGYGYNFQYSRNQLQLNAGVFPNAKGPNSVIFSEIACKSGVYATDWSWSALFCDLDLDGWRDLYISNGILRRSNDLDYIKFIEADSFQFRFKEEGVAERDLTLAKLMPSIKLPNAAYQNKGQGGLGVSFTDRAADWGLDQPSWSNGAAYADLDNDGDLDLAVNNLQDPAFIYKNLTRDAAAPVNAARHFLTIKFAGNGQNKWGVGARVCFDLPQGRMYQENFPTRGYLSSVEPVMTLGLGAATNIERLTVIWPDGAFQILTNVAADQTLTLQQSAASGKFDWRQLLPTYATQPVFTEINTGGLQAYAHRENKFIEFNRERLLPHMSSAEGPKLAVADVDGDGLDDVFVGGAKWQPGSLFLQTAKGDFKSLKISDLEQDSLFEDVGAAFFDADGDQLPDLVVVSGGNEFREGAAELKPRLYRNVRGQKGAPLLRRLPDAFGQISVNGSCVAPADFDGDGDVDLFIGGRSVPWNYGLVPRSYLLANDGKGNFTDVTAAIAPALERPGLIKDAVWADLDGDKKTDLILAGEWAAPGIFYNKNGKLAPGTALREKGWWNCVEVADLDGDGDLDLVAGNYGLNSKLTAAPERPVTMLVKDFDGNETIDQLLCYFYGDQEILFATKDELNAQIPSIKKKFLKYHDFAEARIDEVFDRKKLKEAPRLQVDYLQSAWFENKSGGQFEAHALPSAAQISPVQSILVRDFNGDGLTDLLTVGNYYDVNPELGRYDASYGTLLCGDGKGNFRVLSPAESGLVVKGQCRDAQVVQTASGQLLLVARNKERLGVYLSNSLDSKIYN